MLLFDVHPIDLPPYSCAIDNQYAVTRFWWFFGLTVAMVVVMAADLLLSQQQKRLVELTVHYPNPEPV
jgi:hypothetical protein